MASLVVGVVLSSALTGATFGFVERSPERFPGSGSVSTPAPSAARRGDRPVTVAVTPPPRDRVIRVPTVTREGDMRVVRKKPFGYAAAPLAVAAPPVEYARFDPLEIYSVSREDRIDPTFATIYDADVESEVTLRRLPFDANATFHPSVSSERLVRREVLSARAKLRGADEAFAALKDGAVLKDGAKSTKNALAAIEGASPVASPANSPLNSPLKLPTTAHSYAPAGKDIAGKDIAEGDIADRLDPLGLASRRAAADAVPAEAKRPPHDNSGLAAATLSAALTLGSENVSRVEQSDSSAWAAPVSREAVVTLKTDSPILPAILGGLRSYGADASLLRAVSGSLRSHWGARARDGGTVMLRLAWRAPTDDSPAAERELRRVSVYEAENHVATLARSDAGGVVEAPAPATIEVDAGEREKRRIALSRAMPTVYDGLMRAALSQGLTPDHARRLVRTMAFDVDFRAKAAPEDELEVFYSLSEGSERPSDESRILYAAATIGGVTRRYYRFAHLDSKGETVTDFYDAEGRSAKKFLMRQPVPNGRFTSGYGMRRHPISRYRKMHTGVDWAARSGTPILAAGNGTIVKRGWAGGYGRQVKIRHANGYVTSYSHMRRYARGLKVGSRVRQGQPIGQVGSSGASTGPHLHYEVLVNGRRVNPMRIRLPRGRTLEGKVLAAFERERDRVDALVKRGRGNVEVAGG